MFDTQYGEEKMRNIDTMLVDFLQALKAKDADAIVQTNMLFIKELSKTQALPSIRMVASYAPDGLLITLHFPAIKALACPVCKKELVKTYNEICEPCCQRLNAGT